MTYILNIGKDKTREIIKNIIHEIGLDDSAETIEIKTVEFSEAEDKITVNVVLKDIISTEILDKLRNYLDIETGKQTKITTEFSDDIPREKLINNYWGLFLNEDTNAKIWLENTKVKAYENTVFIACNNDFIYKNLLDEKISKEIFKKIRAFFKFDPDIKVLKEAMEINYSYLRPSQTKIVSIKTNQESKILKPNIKEENVTPIENIIEQGKYVIEGRVFLDEEYKRKVTKEGSGGNSYVIMTLYITNEIDTLKCFTFLDEDDALINEIKNISYARAVVEVKYDEREEEITGRLRQIQKITKEQKQDISQVKRIELHAHTKMSAMDAVMDVEDYIKTAARWGHKAAAITDHGVVHVYPQAYKIAQKQGIKLILGLEGYIVDDIRADKTNKPNHIILLVKNKQGLKNLYKLVSLAHLNYFYKKPRIPRFELIKHRDGLILGTACYLGELYQAILNNKGEEKIREIIDFYDYLEIQPIDNNKFLVREGKVESTEGIKAINIKIFEYGKKYNKPVVATGDVHYLSEEHKIYREVLLLSQGFDEIEGQESANLYLRTTNEMLEEFKYLGEDNSYEVVIKNPERIEKMIDAGINPIPEEFAPPYIADSDDQIVGITWENARKIYGQKIPDQVEERIKRELDAIIKHNFSVLYLIAKKMVDKSLQDGYIVGSRGSVGSSLVAFLCGISEVNPLEPHYICKQCKHFELTQEGFIGVDLKDKNCPICGEKMSKEGFNIPFETFLGFKGDKIPDIDLNFSDEYQDRIHDFVEEFWGKGKVYRCGTINTIKLKAAKRDFVNKYMEKKGRTAKKAEIERLARGCMGIKRTTGQHPGGIILIPENREIYDFTPVQYPADSKEKDVIVTHFEYDFMHDALVKIDALGHKGPTSLKRLCEVLKINVEDIPLDDKKTMKLFSDIKVLGVNEKKYDYPVGTLGIPEYGTKFVRGMLAATKPKTFSELIYIAGLSHGTDVWRNNAEELIKAKKATLKEVISVRDDIMNFLINKCLSKEKAFNIMEKVRRGKGLSAEEKDEMRKNKVPEWYIESCEKIKYMFPKAHAVAYAILSFKIAYFKMYHPLYFYADFFNRNVTDFKYEFAFSDIDKLYISIKELKMKKNLEPKEAAALEVMEVVMEMKERGGELSNIDIYESEANIFKVKEGKILMPLTIIPELGLKVADAVIKERCKAKFSSMEDMVKRTKINKNVSKFIQDNGFAKGLPQTEQTVLF